MRTFMMEKLVEKELSGSEALKHIDVLSKFHRLPGTPDFHRAASYCFKYLEECGLDEVRVDKYPLDGNHEVVGLTLPMAWEVKDVELKVMEPIREMIVNFRNTPSCIYWYSAPTVPGGVVAELVYVGSGLVDSDYEKKDVQGKIYLLKAKETQSMDWV